MKIYTFYTPSHEVFYNEWFLPSFQDSIEISCEKFDQHCQTGEFMSEGWNKTMLQKLDYIIHAIDDSDRYFIHADCDMQFFRPIVEDLTLKMERNNLDMLAQLDSNKVSPQRLCAGFFIARSSSVLRSLFSEARDLVARGIMNNDQAAMNALLIFGTYRLRSTCLGADYFSVFMGNGGRKWEPGQKINLPPDIKMHHANWAISIDHKIQLLQSVKDKFNSNRHSGFQPGFNNKLSYQ